MNYLRSAATQGKVPYGKVHSLRNLPRNTATHIHRRRASLTTTNVSKLYRPMLLLPYTTYLQPEPCMDRVYKYQASQ